MRFLALAKTRLKVVSKSSKEQLLTLFLPIASLVLFISFFFSISISLFLSLSICVSVWLSPTSFLWQCVLIRTLLLQLLRLLCLATIESSEVVRKKRSSRNGGMRRETREKGEQLRERGDKLRNWHEIKAKRQSYKVKRKPE